MKKERKDSSGGMKMCAISAPLGESCTKRVILGFPLGGELYETRHLRLPPWGKLSTKLTDEG